MLTLFSVFDILILLLTSKICLGVPKWQGKVQKLWRFIYYNDDVVCLERKRSLANKYGDYRVRKYGGVAESGTGNGLKIRRQ